MLEEILRQAAGAGASDVHFNVGLPPLFRIHSQIHSTTYPPVTADGVEEMAKGLLGDARWREFLERRDADFSHHIAGVSRFRVNAHFQRGGIALSVRLVSEKVRPLDQLSLPEAVAKLTHARRGLILVTGPTGGGKSTTLAGMIDAINRRERGRILTLEDPIEHHFVGLKSCIEQREVGSDVPTFASGLRHALRQDPDVIFVGEMRDLETTAAALTAAATGHLVLSTLHTVSAPQTVERIIDLHPGPEQNQVRSMLAGVLQGVVSQTLLRRHDQPGMVAAVEVLLCTPAVRNCIRENRIFEIPNVMETSRAAGMQTLDGAIRQLFVAGSVSRDVAMAHANFPEKFERSLAA